MFVKLSALAAALCVLSTSVAADTIRTVHGSGTTNPSKCYWNVMDELTTRAKLPIRMTYRAVGSSTGQKEFINANTAVPAADFGSGDIPLTSEQYADLQTAGIEAVHLPVFVGAVAVFHSVPMKDNEQLKLTGCLLARIYTNDINDWSDPDIVALNPGMDLPSGGLPIKVARRVKGSSSTAAFTEYMNKSCPATYDSSLVGALPAWPTNNAPDVLPNCQGSSGMARCITENAGAVGYIDAGHGLSAGLTEVLLPKSAGSTDYWTSQQAVMEGGIQQAESGILPATPDADFGDVSLIGRPGGAWPMVLLTYVYVRKDLSFIESDEERGLLIAFLRALYDQTYVTICQEEYGFMLPSQEIRDFAIGAIDDLEAAANGTQWTFESSTQAVEGAGDYVLSVKRKSVSDLERDNNMDAISQLAFAQTDMQTKLSAAIAEIESLTQELKEKHDKINELDSALATMKAIDGGSQQKAIFAEEGFEGEFTDDDEKQLKAALAMASISFVFWILFGLFAIFRMMKG